MELEEILSSRIVKHSLPLWKDGYYKHAAFESMTQVEQALKEKGLVTNKSKVYGHTLISNLLGLSGKSVKLRIQLGDDLQPQAEEFFKGVFGYYRNYVAHDGSKIDKTIGLRVMIIASELLDMIDASYLSFADLGGIDGLIKIGEFSSKQQIYEVLDNLESQFLPDGDTDGLFEELFTSFGIIDRQLNALIDLDLVRYIEEDYFPSLEEMSEAWKFPPPQTMAHFEITDLGKRFMDEIDQDSKRES
jgi:hypothetical protein